MGEPLAFAEAGDARKPTKGGTMNPFLASDELARRFTELGVVTRSVSMRDLLQKAWDAAQQSNTPILIEGATGTGKSDLAQAIHCLDQRRAGHRFVTVHCAAIQQTVAESELFGHERGAFSGAMQERKGLFRAADKGSVFLDDVGDLPATLQPKLLDVLQRKIVRPVGSDREHRIDVRVIAASNETLETLVEQDRFRADLYYRLNVIGLRLPPLRQRPEDIGALVLELAKRHRNIYGPITDVEPELENLLRTLPFPGNVRELENMVRRMLVAKRNGTSLAVEDLPDEASDPPNRIRLRDEAAASIRRAIAGKAIGLRDAVREAELRLVSAALAEAGPSRTRREIAEMLQMSERALYRKLRDLRLTNR